MSQQEQSKNSNDNESKTIENVPLSLHNINNLLNTSDLNSSKKDNNVLTNNFIEITSFSNNNKPENNAKITNSSNYSNLLQNADISIDSFIILLYKEIFITNKSLLNIDIKIDDRINNLDNCETKLLFSNWHNRNIPKEELEEKNIIVVESWKDIEELLLKEER